ncbi:BatD family protein [Persicitalea jodogahamensis]|nr:BatD family protein [Persicitalea jodogahamensis]
MAQQPAEKSVSVEMGEKDLAINQPFVVSVVVRNSTSRPSVQFPELPGLEKRSASATSTTNVVNGKTVLIQTISQQYFAKQEGKNVLLPFEVTVDGTKVKSEGTTLTFNKVEGGAISTENSGEAEEIISSAEDLAAGSIFLSVKVSKPIVYVREGFSVRLALYVAKSAPVEMEFYQLDVQLQNILKKLRPATCWEENVGIEEIVQREVTVGNKKFTEYQMYQSVFFPITLQSVSFPAVKLDMLLLKTLPDGQKKKEVESFYSRPVRVLVKPLPSHPRKDQIAVGNYQLGEKLTRDKVYSGESLRYEFTIKGDGNIATITPPEMAKSMAFDFYPPDVSQTVQRSYEKVSGEKTFGYNIVARQKGNFTLGRFFQWIYFDPVRAKYDTLRSSRTVEVTGENLRASALSGEGADPVYGNIDELDTNVRYIDYQEIIRNLTNAVVLILLGAMVWIFRK